MRVARLCWLGLAVGLAALVVLAGTPQASAQDQPEIEITPQIPHSEPVTSVAFSPDGTRVLSGSLDNTLKLWDAATGQLIHTFEGYADGVLGRLIRTLGYAGGSVPWRSRPTARACSRAAGDSGCGTPPPAG